MGDAPPKPLPLCETSSLLPRAFRQEKGVCWTHTPTPRAPHPRKDSLWTNYHTLTLLAPISIAWPSDLERRFRSSPERQTRHRTPRTALRTPPEIRRGLTHCGTGSRTP